MTKRCTKCGEEKDLSCFGVFKNGRNQNYRETRCYECKRKISYAYYNVKRTEYNATARIREAKHKCKLHGVTLQWLDDTLKTQNNHCAICGNSSARRLCIDHNHLTNQVRGLLCSKCNFILGLANDRVEVLQNAVAYLQKHQCLQGL